MATLDSFYRAIYPHAPLAPKNLIDYALVVGAHNFCNDTLLVQTTSTPQPVVAGQTEYEILDQACEGEHLMLTRVLWATLDGQDLVPRIDGGFPVTSSAATSAAGTSFLVRGDGTLKFLQPPTETGAQLVVCAALTPKMTATELPDLLLERYLEAIAAAARVYLNKMEAPWASPGGLELAGAEYLRLVRAAKNEFWDSHARGEHTLHAGSRWA